MSALARVPRPSPSVALGTTLPVALLGLAFWGHAWSSARGFFPAPLDDVYIHFDFARSLATGHPFEWLPGNGYSSGETAPLYAIVLAAGWALGFRGPWLGAWAALVALSSVASLVGSVRRLLEPCRPVVSWLAPLLVLSSALVDWSLFSGMEVALHGAVLGRALLALDRATSDIGRRGGLTRASCQVRLGVWCAALVALRPESVALVPVLAVVAARAIGDRSAVRALGRVSVPAATPLLVMLATNRLVTGDARAAGAQLKLLSSNPYLSDVDRARGFAENLLTFVVRVVRTELGSLGPLAWALPLLVVSSLVVGRRRPVAAACVTGALAWVLLASWNGNAPFHNFRYYAAPLLLLLVAAALGAAALARTRRGAVVATGAVLASMAAGASRLPFQIEHFRRSVANVRDQQVEVGLRLAESTPRDARVLVGDAGAIPYVSGRVAIDALGLGGYRTMPFARAAVHGEPAILELLERLTADERPTHLALYPNWFPVLTSRFGVELDRVTIQDNVICGGPTKVVYRADWSALAPAGRLHGLGDDVDILDELDVGDVISEAEHAYLPPTPDGGWTTLDVLADEAGERRFDGGRIVPEGKRESFVIRRGKSAPVTLVVRTDAGAGRVRVRSAREDVELVLEPARDGAWRLGRAELPSLEAGDRVTLEAVAGALRDHHVWLTAPRGLAAR